VERRRRDVVICVEMAFERRKRSRISSVPSSVRVISTIMLLPQELNSNVGNFEPNEMSPKDF
jgi:hypothetical protein